MNWTRLCASAALVAVAAISTAQNFSVTSPANGTFVSGTATVQFNITGLTGTNNRKVFVRATARKAGVVIATSDERDFTPNADGKIENQSVTLSFQTGTGGAQDGNIAITTAVRFEGVTTPWSSVVRSVVLDTVAPKFLEFAPLDGAFIRRGTTYDIRAALDERNLKEWRVQVNSQNIPNNTGTSRNVSVLWNTANIQFDGQASIGVRATDEADQPSERTLNVTLDSIAPVASIVFPTTDTRLNRNSTINVTIDVDDASTSSVDVTGLDVTLRTTDGRFLFRVARSGFQGASGNTSRWTGRIRKDITRRLPSSFVMRVEARDRAGNVANVQTARLTIR